MSEWMTVNIDAWSSGQIGSKLWLCRELERLNPVNPVIWILGGWYGLLAFLLLSRERVNIKHIRSFDLDRDVERPANFVNENWVWREWQFKAFTFDANNLTYHDNEFGPSPDIIINTSTEHFTSFDWFKNIPHGKMVVLQSTDMIHDDHLFAVRSMEEFRELFPLSQCLYQGELEFCYPESRFKRFMLIGIK